MLRLYPRKVELPLENLELTLLEDLDRLSCDFDDPNRRLHRREISLCQEFVRLNLDLNQINPNVIEKMLCPNVDLRSPFYRRLLPTKVELVHDLRSNINIALWQDNFHVARLHQMFYRFHRFSNRILEVFCHFHFSFVELIFHHMKNIHR